MDSKNVYTNLYRNTFNSTLTIVQFSFGHFPSAACPLFGGSKLVKGF